MKVHSKDRRSKTSEVSIEMNGNFNHKDLVQINDRQLQRINPTEHPLLRQKKCHKIFKLCGNEARETQNDIDGHGRHHQPPYQTLDFGYFLQLASFPLQMVKRQQPQIRGNARRIQELKALQREK